MPAPTSTTSPPAAAPARAAGARPARPRPARSDRPRARRPARRPSPPCPGWPGRGRPAGSRTPAGPGRSGARRRSRSAPGELGQRRRWQTGQRSRATISASIASRSPPASSVCSWLHQNLRTTRSASPPRPCCTIISTVDCARPASSSWPTRSATGCRRTDAEGARPLVHRRGRLRLAGAVPGDVRPHGGGHADLGRAATGSPRSARSTWPPTVWSTPRCASPPSSTWSAACSCPRWWRRCWPGSRRGRCRPARPAPRSGSAPC